MAGKQNTMAAAAQASATPAPAPVATGTTAAQALDEVLTRGTTTLAPPVDKKTAVIAATGGYDVAEVGTGFEDFTQDDLAVPFIAILQKGSPQVEEENPKRLAGAKAGSLMDTVSNELFDGKVGIPVIPVHRTRSFIEWIPKDDGGGLVNVYDPTDPIVLAILKKAGKKFGKLKINDNNDLVETFNVFCLIPGDNGMVKRVVIGFASSQIGMYKKWMTRAQSIQIVGASGVAGTPPMFSHRYRLTTQFFQKKENTWYKWVANFDGADAAACRLAETDPLYEHAKEFRGMLLSGRAAANFETATQESAAEAEGYEM
jgi:hypothetical protein